MKRVTCDTCGIEDNEDQMCKLPSGKYLCYACVAEDETGEPVETITEEVEEAIEIIKYTPELVIKNIEQLSAGTGARYLEAIKSARGEYIAAQWRRVKTTAGPGRILIDMDGGEEPEDNGSNGQDRENYTDNQDRENYTQEEPPAMPPPAGLAAQPTLPGVDTGRAVQASMLAEWGTAPGTGGRKVGLIDPAPYLKKVTALPGQQVMV